MQDQSVENESQDYSIQLCDLCSQLVNRRKQMISQFVESCQNLQEMAKDQPKYKKCVHLMTSLFHLNDGNFFCKIEVYIVTDLNLKMQNETSSKPC
jgi:hypothetical protein